MERRKEKRRGRERSEKKWMEEEVKKRGGKEDRVDDYSPTNSYKGFVLPAFLQQAV